MKAMKCKSTIILLLMILLYGKNVQALSRLDDFDTLGPGELYEINCVLNTGENAGIGFYRSKSNIKYNFFETKGLEKFVSYFETTNEQPDQKPSYRYNAEKTMMYSVYKNKWDIGKKGKLNFIIDVNRGSKTPEPAAMLLFGTGLIGIAGIARKSRLKRI